MTEPDPHPIFTELQHELLTPDSGSHGQAGSPPDPADDADQTASR